MQNIKAKQDWRTIVKITFDWEINFEEFSKKIKWEFKEISNIQKENVKVDLSEVFFETTK